MIDTMRELNADELRLYDLVWKRTVASQMTDAVGRTVSVRFGAVAADGTDAVFAASGRTITFPGYMRAYVEGADDPDAELEDRETFRGVTGELGRIRAAKRKQRSEGNDRTDA